MPEIFPYEPVRIDIKKALDLKRLLLLMKAARSREGLK